MKIDELRRKFPQLSAEFPTDFRKFFSEVTGEMNSHGYRAYDLIKARKRIKELERKLKKR